MNEGGSVIEVRTQNWDGKFARLCIDYAHDLATGMHKALVGVHDEDATLAKEHMREIMNWDPMVLDTIPSKAALGRLNAYVEQMADLGSGMAMAWLSMAINAEGLLGASHEAIQHGKKRILKSEDAE
jgi:hypothetical protein